MKRTAVSATWVVAFTATWIASLGNVALWRRLMSLGMLNETGGWAFFLAMFVIVWSSVASLIWLFAWRKTLKIAVSLLLCISALATYFMLTYGVVMDPSMLTNVMQTDVHEIGGLLNGHMAFTLIVLALAPMIVLARCPIEFGSTGGQWGKAGLGLAASCVLFVVSALISFQPLSALMRNHKDVRYLINPMASVYSLGRVVTKSWQGQRGKVQEIAADATLKLKSGSGERPTLLLLVLGETARSDHFGINGYARNTTPALKKHEVVSFRNAWACGTSTAASVPCMFSHLGREGFEAQSQRYEGLLDVLQRAGLAVLWLDNQSGCKGVCDRVPNASITEGSDSAHCKDGECLDEALLAGLDRRISELDAKRATKGIVIVMHQMGSHGPAYHLRSPAQGKQFTPECMTAALNNCSQETVVNAYDNSILYTDHFLGEAIDWLKTKERSADTAMVYVSDHGESLGENNLYLHGLPYVIAPDVQKHVPWVTWISGSYQRNKGLPMPCLRDEQMMRVSHDNYFHSVLGLMDVQTSAYQASMDAYASCRGGNLGQAKAKNLEFRSETHGLAERRTTTR